MVAHVTLDTTTMPQQAYIHLANHFVLDPLKAAPKPRQMYKDLALYPGDRIVAGFVNNRGTLYAPITKYVRHR